MRLAFHCERRQEIYTYVKNLLSYGSFVGNARIRVLVTTERHPIFWKSNSKIVLLARRPSNNFLMLRRSFYAKSHFCPLMLVSLFSPTGTAKLRAVWKSQKSDGFSIWVALSPGYKLQSTAERWKSFTAAVFRIIWPRNWGFAVAVFGTPLESDWLIRRTIARCAVVKNFVHDLCLKNKWAGNFNPVLFLNETRKRRLSSAVIGGHISSKKNI